MRVAAAVLLVCALLAPAAEQNAAFFPVGIDYPPDARTPSSQIAGDLQVIRSAGFNTIKTAISWREAEPARGEYRFDALQRTLEAAGQSGVRLILQIDRAAPEWVFTRYAASGNRTGQPAADCFRHPEARADQLRFVSVAAKTAARFQSLLAIDVGSSPSAGPCLREFADEVRQAVPVAVSVNSHTVRPSLLPGPAADAASDDDWLSARTVDRYGMLVDASTPAAELSLAFDNVAGVSRRGWWLYSGAIPEPVRRFAAWMAISRGAQGVIFDDPPQDTGFIRTIARNPSLFTQLRPRRSPVALVFDRLGPSGASAQILAPIHRALHERQIAVDIVSAEDLTDASAAGYLALVTSSPRELLRKAGGIVIDAAAAANVADVVERLVGAGVRPEVRIEGGSDVEVRFLESPTVQMIVALNHASQSQRVMMTFSPETQEAIWLNMETGTGVNFVAGPAGPRYQYWFRPKDALVLMIRKDIR